MLNQQTSRENRGKKTSEKVEDLKETSECNSTLLKEQEVQLKKNSYYMMRLENTVKSLVSDAGNNATKSCILSQAYHITDTRNKSAEAEFRKNKGFIFFQHISKAGGTYFCLLSMQNYPPGWDPPVCG